MQIGDVQHGNVARTRVEDRKDLVSNSERIAFHQRAPRERGDPYRSYRTECGSCGGETSAYGHGVDCATVSVIVVLVFV